MEQQFQHNQVVLVLDADEIAYQIACACEQRGVVATNTTNEAQANFKHKTAFKDFTAGLDIPEGHFVLEETQIAEDPKNAFATVKAKINNLKSKFNTDRVELYLSGKDNFRLNIPLPEQYKASRKTQLRPLLLDQVKDYLIKYHGAVAVAGDEADQMVAQRMWDGYKSRQFIIGCSVDKDAKGNMGWLYNPDKDDLLYIDGSGELTKDDKGKVRGHGRLWLYHQLCVGDWNTDHFCPRQIVKAATGVMPKFGETASYNLLKDCKSDKEAWTAIHDLYLKWFGAEKFSYTAWNGETITTDYLGALQMIWDCAFMKRFEGDKVDVRVVLKKLGVIE